MNKNNAPKTLHVGFGNTVMVDRVLGIFAVDTSPVKKMVNEAKTIGFVIDLTKDKKTKTAILLDTGNIVLSPINHTTLANRLNKNECSIFDELLKEDYDI